MRRWPHLAGGTLTRLIAATFIAGIVAAVVASAFLSTAGRSTLRDDVMGQNGVIASHLAARFSVRIDDHLDSLEMLASSGAFLEPEVTAAAELRTMLRASPRYDELTILDLDGRAVAVAAARSVVDPDELPIRDDVIRGLEDGRFVALRDDAPTVVELGVLLTDADGRPLGVLLAAAPLEVLQSYLLEVDPIAGTRRGFVDASGRVVVHPERDLVVSAEIVPFGMEGDTRAEVVRADRTVLVSGAPTRHLGGTVIVEQDEVDALRPVAERIRQLNTLLVAVIGAIVLTLVVVGGYVLRPLRPLTEAVERLGRGDRMVRIDAPGDHEIGRLARSFNTLVAELGRHEHQLGELERLALAISTRVEREPLCRDIVGGARSLLRAEAAVLVVDGEDEEPVVAVEGPVPPEVIETMGSQDAAIVEIDRHGDSHHVRVGVPGADGTALGSLLLVRGSPPGARETDLLASFVAFAGVTLENVMRLELERRLVDELQDAVDQRRDLVSSVTHELRTPLVCIQGFSETLLESWHEFDDDERRGLLGRVVTHAEDLDDLVTRLLDFSLIERGALVLEAERIRLDDAIAEVVSSLHPVLDGRPMLLDLAEVEVVADRRVLGRVVMNLLSNAVKYSEPGTPIGVSARARSDRGVVEVSDEGVGMTPAELEQAFQPFWRAGRAGVRAVRGAGIGLSLVAEYVRLMGGEHGARSEIDRGSTFHFTVPLAPVVAEPIDVAAVDP